MKAKEEWIQEVMDSLDEVNHAVAPMRVQQEILRRVSLLPRRVVVLPRRAIWLMAAGISLLIAINAYALAGHKFQASPDKIVSNPLVSEYFNYPPTI